MAEPTAANRPSASRWPAVVGLLLSLVGLGLSIYLTVAHYTTPTLLACPETGLINCAKVTTSSYSEILGIPVALLGLLYFVAMVPLQLPAVWRLPWPWLSRLRLALATTGIVMILWLIYVELYRLDAICLYCTAVHITTLLLFGVTAVGTALATEV